MTYILGIFLIMALVLLTGFCIIGAADSKNGVK